MPETNADSPASSASAQHTVIYANDLSGIKPPNFDWEAPDLAQQFRKFKRYCELLLSTPGYAHRANSDLVNYILLWLGPQGVEIFDNLTLTDEQRKTPKKVWEAFENYFEPKSNYRLARFQLRDMRQQPQEPIDSFITRLRAQAQKCNFTSSELTEDNLIDQIIKGVFHDSIRKKLLDKDPGKLKLDECIQYARIYETTTAHLQSLQAVGVHEVTEKSKTHKKHYKNPRKTEKPVSRKTPSSCYFCGKTYHTRDKCPAREHTCTKCNNLGHWEQVCQKSKQKSSSTKSKQHVHTVETHEQEDFEKLNFHNVTTNDGNEAHVEIQTFLEKRHPRPLSGKIDTGSAGNIIPLRIFKQIWPDKIGQDGRPTITTPSNINLIAYNGGNIPHYGAVKLPCRYRGKYFKGKFFIANTDGPTIFGLELCQKLNIVVINAIQSTPLNELDKLKQNYPTCFQGLGKLPYECQIALKPDAVPVQRPSRRPPIQLRQKIRDELKRMEELGVIKKMSQPTDWVSNITYVTKSNGSLRICLDPRDLNKNIKRNPHHIPTTEEIIYKLNGATTFSKLDAKSGYWTIPIKDECQSLTTFNSPFGRYCFQRLPFGLSISQDIFQAAMDSCLDGLDGVVSIADDIVVFGKTRAEHDNNLKHLMERAKSKNIVFNAEKCHINCPSITFFGHVYDKEGVHPDPEKVQGIQDVLPPTTVKELQSFLGLITYLSSFIPKLSEHTAPLRTLLQQDVEFQWHPEHQTAFDMLKNLIKEDNTLAYFDHTQPTYIEVDASQNALGTALIQNNKVIAYASKSLTKTESRYANIERELLACVFGAERFHTYIYGSSFCILSDHKPLEMIHKKPLSAAPPRLQRLLLRLQKYNFNITYKPGKEMTLADSLSRLPKNHQDKAIDIDIQVNYVQFDVQNITKLREATKNDQELSLLMKYIVDGFPNTIQELPR